MLDMFFNPQSVALVGASRDETKLGYAILNNLIHDGYQGKIYPINPKAEDILGLKSYASVSDVPGPIDTVLIVIPGRFVAPVLKECGEKGVKGAIIISAGFREAGQEGAQLEKELVAIAKQYGIRLVGPNCLGIINTASGLNASFAPNMPAKGSVAFMSQSGALGSAVLDWALAEEVGFSSFVSLGNKADVSEIDLLAAWEEDPNTRVILGYMEGLPSGQEFMRVARRVSKKKPIIAVKSGKTAAGSRAVSSHTGSLAGSEQSYEAAFRQSGVLRADSVQELFDASIAFAYQPALKGPNIAVVTNAGGPGIMATDALESCGLRMATLEDKTVSLLQEKLPPAANTHNPIDVLGDAFADRYAVALDAALKDANVDGVLLILTPQLKTQIEETATVVGEIARQYNNKPVLAVFMGEAKVRAGIKILNSNQVPAYLFPERAVGAMRFMYDHYLWTQQPEPEFKVFDVDKERVRDIFAKARADGRVTLGDAEARDIMEAYGIRIPRSELARNAEEAVQYARSIGYPVVMKIASPDILHKSDMGGVRVNVRDDDQVRDVFDILLYRAHRYMPDAEIWGVLVQEMVTGGKEVIIGVNRDPQFGPLLMFGLGGIYVEVLKDVTFRIPLISAEEARKMVSEIKTYALLRGVRGQKPSDIDGIVDCVLRVAQLVTDFPEIVEMDINPLLVKEAGAGAISVDMRFVLSA
ncbi:MAG: acetate--CoA ligase [Chloroflexi bacterium]|nr:acetate--CoA ligase [Chloroflexota bacterium]